MPSQAEISESVKEILVDALGLDEDEITDQASLMGDLGAESIDILDIVFRLEKKFNVKIPRTDLVPEGLANAENGYVENGVLNAKGIAELKQRLPFADIEKFAKNPKVEHLKDLLTVKVLSRIVESKLS